MVPLLPDNWNTVAHAHYDSCDPTAASTDTPAVDGTEGKEAAEGEEGGASAQLL